MILVTGANGLIGSFICEALKKNDIPFHGLVRKHSDLTLVKDVLDNLIYGNFMDLEFMHQQIQNFSSIIHCAGFVSFTKDQKDQMFEVNVEGTKQLVNLALASNLDYFLHISSVAAIGRSKEGGSVSEANDWINSKENTLYGESKYLAELEVWRAVQEGLKASIINPSVVLGPGNWNKSSTKLFKYVWNENKYYGRGTLNYVDVRDIASIVMKLLKKKISNERFIVNAGIASYKEFFDMVAKEFAKKPPTREFKTWQGRIAIIISYLARLTKNSEALITNETIRLANNRTIFDASKIRNTLSFEFKKLEDTVMWSTQELIKNNR